MSEVVERGNREKQGNGELPEGWVWTKLGDIIHPSKDKIDPKDAENVPYIGLEHIEKETGKLVEHGSSDEVRSAKSVFKSGDLLYGKLRPYLNKVCIADFDGVCSTDILVFPKNSSVPNHFLLYRLLSPDFVRYANLRMSGVQHPRVHFDELAKFRFKLPPLKEQNRIVEAIETQFTRLDAAVKALERAQIKLKRYRASVLQSACEGRLVPTEAALARREDRDHPYEPADQLLERILVERRRKWEEERWEYEIERAKKKAAQAERKAAGLPYYIRELEPEHWQDRAPEEYEKYLPKSDKWKEKYDEPKPPDIEDLPELPEGWCWATVDQVSVMSQYGTSDKAKYEYSGIPVLRMGNIQGGQLDYSDLKRMPADWSDVDKFILQPGDLLFNRTNSAELVGKTAIYEEHHPESVFASYLVRVKTSDYLLSDFLSFYINSILGREYINSVVSQQVGQANVNATKLSKMTFALPPLSEQHRIVAEVERRLSVIDALEKAVATNLTRAERMRQAILKKAFEGRLVEQRPEDGDAKDLLEGITK